MTALWYLSKQSFINGLKRLKEEPKRILPMLFVALFLIMGVLSLVFSEAPSVSNAAEIAKRQTVIQGAFFALLTLTFCASCYSGIANGSSFFLPADTQFLFTAPLTPQTTMIYGLLRSMKNAAFSSFYLIYQMKAIRMAKVSYAGLAGLFGLYLLTLLSTQSLASLLYAISYDKPGRRRFLISITWLLPLLLLPLAFVFWREHQALEASFSALVASPWLRAFPVTGLALLGMDGILHGFGLLETAGVLLLALIPPLSLLLLYRLPVDFYEDAMRNTAQLAKAELSPEEAKRSYEKQYLSKKKVGHSGLVHGWGLSAVFFRQWRELRRQRPYVISFGMLLILAFTAFFASQMHGLGLGERQARYTIYLGVLSAYSLLTSMGSPAVNELQEDAFYLLPFRPLWLLAVSNLVGSIYRLASLIPAALIMWLWGQVPLGVALWSILYFFSFSYLLMGADLLVLRLLGNLYSALAAFLLLLTKLLYALPTLLAFIFLGVFQEIPGSDVLSFSRLIFPTFPLIIGIQTLVYLASMGLGVSLLKHGRKS